MRDNLALPFIGATNTCICTEWFVYLKEMMKHCYLANDEKFLWLWLASQSTGNPPFYCSFNYEQISLAVDLPVERIHRGLFRLRTMGFLIAPLPIWYGELTLPMRCEVYSFELLLPPKALLDMRLEKALIIPEVASKKIKSLTLTQPTPIKKCQQNPLHFTALSVGFILKTTLKFLTLYISLPKILWRVIH